MHIFINALSARLGGGQTYILNLLHYVPREVQVTILVQPSFCLGELPTNVTRIEKNLTNPFVRRIWEEFFLSKILDEIKVDLFFSPGGLLPYNLPGRIKKIVTFQNMLPFDDVQRRRYSYGYRRLRDWLLRLGLTQSMFNANLVIFISEYAKDFIHENLNGFKTPFIMVPHGVDEMFSRKNYFLSKPSWIPVDDYFLYVSFIDYYKGQLELVKGFDLYRKRGGMKKLVLIGAEYKPYGKVLRELISELGLNDHVFIIGNVHHNELPHAYQNASVNIFASFTENCPNILLEMMSSGRPALVSKYGPMPEIGKNAVEYFDPSNIDEVASKLNILETNLQIQQRNIKASLIQARKYKWKKSAKSTWDAMLLLERV